MGCFYCKGVIKDNFTTHVVKLEACIIIIKNVPCTKCVQCGESFYNNNVALQLEKIVKEMKTNITEVAIVKYSAA